MHSLRTVRVLPLLVLVTSAAACAPPDALDAIGSGAMLAGAIFTTDSSGGAVNNNVFERKADVWLNGGPPQPGAAGLPDGVYVIGVTDPDGSTLLSPLPLKTATVVGGEFTALVQLAPFGDSETGVYKVWATPEGDYGATGPGAKSGFLPSKSKTDNFRVTGEDGTGGGGTGGDTGGGGTGGGGTGGGAGDGDAPDADGDGCADSYGALYGDIYGEVHGDFHGDVYGDVYGNLHGDVHGSLLGDLYGNVMGDVHGDVWGDVYGDIHGSLHGRLFGDLYGNIYGSVGTGCP